MLVNIRQIKIEDLKPYENNPRDNDEAVPYVENSIEEFGFKVPLVVDRNNVIVCGHTRYKAVINLRKAGKWATETLPCVIADDLSDEQIKAFRLADNKVSERATWNSEKLDLEFKDLDDFDLKPFGFDDRPEEEEQVEEDPEDDSYYGEERERTGEAYNLDDYDPYRTAGYYEFPVLQKCSYVPDDLIGFNYVLSTERRDAGVHFFIDDYQFERVWNDPMQYLDRLAEFQCVLTPDFSLYMDMPRAMKIWNVYRSRLIGQMMQDAGIKVIPTLQWAEPETYQFVFDGLPEGGTVAVSTVGVMKDEEARKVWTDGMSEAIRRLKPKTILLYGSEMPDFDFKGIRVVHFDARKFKK